MAQVFTEVSSNRLSPDDLVAVLIPQAGKAQLLCPDQHCRSGTGPNACLCSHDLSQQLCFTRATAS